MPENRPTVPWDEDDDLIPTEQSEDHAARQAEAFLAGVNIPLYPRSHVEIRILEGLREFYPLPLAPMQLAEVLRLPSAEVLSILQALATLGTVARPSRGYYQHIPLP